MGHHIVVDISNYLMELIKQPTNGATLQENHQQIGTDRVNWRLHPANIGPP